MYPLLFKPILKERIWGGRKLQEKFGRKLPEGRIGESWDIACHPNGTSIIDHGVFKGRALSEIIEELGKDILGKIAKEDGVIKFPLLIKILDASDVLSVQVHPDDEYAAANENGELGKSEMWYILDAEPGAILYYGVKPGTNRDDFRKAIDEGQLESYLCCMEVKKGDVIYIPAGMVHAIGAGIMICEIQQNSDTTYRVYDWNRKGADGKPRELHVEKALDVIDFEGQHLREKVKGLTIDEQGNKRTFYVACKHFAMEKLEINSEMEEDTDGDKFFTLTITEGKGEIRYNGGVQPFSAGDSILIPAVLGKYFISGNCTVAKAYVPDRQKDIIDYLKVKGFTLDQMRLIAGLFDE
jgi:mannose-6-phosphate isomerase